MLERKTIARQLSEAARLLDVLNEDRFRSRAYANAARALEAYESDLADLAERGELTQIKGIGDGLAAEITAEPVDGVLPLLAELRSRVPAGVRDLFLVSGLGASKVRALWQAGITSLEALVAGVEAGEVQQLKGFGKKSAASFAEGARFALAAQTRVRRDQAEAAIVELGWVLEEALPDASVTPVGSYRRGLETVGEIDLVIAGVTLAALEGPAHEVMTSVSVHAEDPAGGARIEGLYHDVKVRWFPVADEAAGAAIAIRTGNDAYAAWLQERAAPRGATLRADGLERDGEKISTPAEEDVFGALDLPQPAPELREAPDPDPIPGLLELADIRGVVHNHSTWSDAQHSLREMVAAARAKGFAYLAMADHSRTSYYARGLTEDRGRRQADEIRAIREELAAEDAEFELLHGIEVDILPDGSLDYDDEILELL
ncbi:MAG: helix-hairpin-helix domain-containing protein, partial [Gemmatimonadota bacterium]|nr:helix-hairpin-helix domain-containing protein [Gemmatimonadota bacterium]